MKIYLLILLFLLILPSIQAQKNQAPDAPFDSPKSPIKCADWLNYLGDATLRWNKNKESSFIIIARLGDGEFSRQLNLKRIKTLKDHFSNPRYPVKTVFAEGERTEGFGVIEIYVEGKLLYTLPVSKKEDVALRYCPIG